MKTRDLAAAAVFIALTFVVTTYTKIPIPQTKGYFNLGEVVIVWLIFLVVGIAVGVLIGLPLAFVTFAALIPLGIAAALSPVMLVPLVMLICFIALLSAALRSIVEAYTSTVWTLAYRQWMAGPAPAPAPVQVVA